MDLALNMITILVIPNVELITKQVLKDHEEQTKDVAKFIHAIMEKQAYLAVVYYLSLAVLCIVFKLNIDALRTGNFKYFARSLVLESMTRIMLPLFYKVDMNIIATIMGINLVYNGLAWLCGRIGMSGRMAVLTWFVINTVGKKIYIECERIDFERERVFQEEMLRIMNVKQFEQKYSFFY